MNKLRIPMLLLVFAVAGIGAGVALAALSDSETASGTVNVSSTSADLYICEPGNIAGPACGADDSDGDEIVFENLEDIRPGGTAFYDIRLKNTGTEPFVIIEGTLAISEASDPGNDCPAASPAPLRGAGSESYYNYDERGISVMGKAGDPYNDNQSQNNNNLPQFGVENQYGQVPIRIAPGDYEDIRLRVRMEIQDVDNCDSNTWNVGWSFTAQ